MKTCESCGRDFARHPRWLWTCPWCGYNTNPRESSPRTEESIKDLEEQRREREEEEAELRDYLDLDPE